MSSEWLSVTHASRWCDHQRFCESCATKCSERDVVVPCICRAGINVIRDFSNVQLFWFLWTVLLICRTMDVAFCLCTVIFIFYMDHASLVFRRCMCTLIVFLIFCNVFTWWYHVTLHCWRIYFFRPHTFCLDIDSIMTYILVMWLDIVGLLEVLHLRQNVFINHFTVLFVFAFSAFHSIRSRIFHPLHTGAAFSNLAFSTLLVYWCRVFRSRIFSRPQIRQTSGLIRQSGFESRITFG